MPVLTSPGGGCCSVLLSDEFPDCPLVSCCLEPESTSPPAIHKLRSLNIPPGTSSFYIVLYIRKNISSFLFHRLILYSMYVPGLNMAGEDWEEGMTLNRLVGTWEEVDDALLLFRTSTYLGTEPTTNRSKVITVTTTNRMEIECEHCYAEFLVCIHHNNL